MGLEISRASIKVWRSETTVSKSYPVSGLKVSPWPPLVDCHYPELLTQYRRDQVPDPAVGGEPMYEHNGLTLTAPVAIVE